MIIKALSRKSNTGQLVKYIFRYVFQENKRAISHTMPEQTKNDNDKFFIRHNVRSKSIKGFIKEFNENESFRLVHRKDGVKLFHTIISFSNKDKKHITDSLLKDVAKKFITERGLNNLYAGTKHEDKDHVHLHLIVSGTQLNGRSSRISKQQLHHIKIALDKYQREKYPQLINSLPEHGKIKKIAREAILETIKKERQSDKLVLMEWLEKAYSNSKSELHFLAQLKELGYQPYFRKNILQGIKAGQRKFRLNRLGFDKIKLLGLNDSKSIQNKMLSELQRIRSGKIKEIKKIVMQRDQENAVSEFNRNEKQLQKLSLIRSNNQGIEIERTVST